MPNPMQRNVAVDAMRLLAVTAVVIIHADVFRNPALEHQTGEFNLYGVVLNQLARFGVPFFFTIAGYFWGLKVRNGTPVTSVAMQTFKRIAPVLGAWTLIYLLPYNLASVFQYGALGPLKVWYWHLRELGAQPFSILFESTHQHLWFLIALLWAVAISTAFIHLRAVKGLLFTAAGLYVIGILALAYSMTPVGIHIDFYTLEGPFFGTAFFVTGYVLSGYKPSARWLKTGLLLALAGYAIHLAEVYVLWNEWQIRPIHHYVFGTWLIGLGVAMATLSDASPVRSATLTNLGRLTLGIYLIHPIFLENIQSLKLVLVSPLWDVFYVVAALALSVLSIRFMAQIPALKKIVV